MFTSKLRTSLVTLITAAAVAAPAIAPAVSQAAPKSGSSEAVTCPGGDKPGDIVESKTVVILNGQIKTKVVKEICGRDGQWHKVATSETGSRLPVAGGISEAPFVPPLATRTAPPSASL